MKTKTLRKIGALLLCVSFLFLKITESAATRITITETQQIAFGTMEIPSSGSNARVVSTAGVGSGGTYITGTVREGRYDFYCVQQCGASQYSSVTLSIVSPGIGNCTGMTSIGTFSGSITNASGVTSAVTFPATVTRANIGTTAGTSRLNVGATATYPSTVTETASCSPSFSVQITVNP